MATGEQREGYWPLLVEQPVEQVIEKAWSLMFQEEFSLVLPGVHEGGKSAEPLLTVPHILKATEKILN